MIRGELFTQLKTLYPTLTKTEKRVADYTMENPGKVLFMSLTDLADACKVEEANVLRLCRTLRLKGYQDFKMHLSLGMKYYGNRSTVCADGAADSVPELSDQISPADSQEILARKVLKANVDALNETYERIDFLRLGQAVDWLLCAREIAFFGVGASMIIAMEAVDRFMRITSNVKCQSDSHLQSMMASLLTGEDVAVIVSYSGTTKDTLQAAELARQSGAKVIAITHYARSPLTALSDLVLLCGAQEGPLQGGSIPAKVSQLYLLDLLYMMFFLHRQEQSIKNKQRTAEAVIDKLL